MDLFNEGELRMSDLGRDDWISGVSVIFGLGFLF
jgi:hypothetical protein